MTAEQLLAGWLLSRTHGFNDDDEWDRLFHHHLNCSIFPSESERSYRERLTAIAGPAYPRTDTWRAALRKQRT